MPSIPTYTVSLDERLDTLFEELEGLELLEGGVSVEGEAAAYALQWEFGNVRQTKKGPKTTLGVNPVTGERVWLSLQAPWGYVRVNESEYWIIIQSELEKMTFKGGTSQEIKAELSWLAARIAVRMVEVIRRAAPKDTGQLERQITPVPPGDSSLQIPGVFEDQVLDLPYTME